MGLHCACEIVFDFLHPLQTIAMRVQYPRFLLPKLELTDSVCLQSSRLYLLSHIAPEGSPTHGKQKHHFNTRSTRDIRADRLASGLCRRLRRDASRACKTFNAVKRLGSSLLHFNGTMAAEAEERAMRSIDFDESSHFLFV